MNALWRPEAKSNRPLFNVIDLTCRYIETLAQQGLRTPGAFVLDAQDVDLAIPDAAGHIGVVSIGGQQPAGDALGQLQQILRRIDSWNRSANCRISGGVPGKLSWLRIGIQANSCPLASQLCTRCATSGS